MLNTAIIKKFTAGLLLLALMGGCRKDNLLPPVDRTTSPRTMGAFIENNYDLSILSAMLKKTNLMDTLNQGGPFTLFAPDNNAFNSMGVRVEDVASMDVDSLRFALRYHLMRNRYFTTTFPQQMDSRYMTLAGEEIYVSTYSNIKQDPDNDVFINGAVIYRESRRNTPLANGVMHIISKPLKLTRGTVQDYIAGDTSLTLFAAAMKQFKLWDGLKTNKPLTVFAPANAAFSKYGITAAKIAAMNPDDYKALVFSIYTIEMRKMRVFSPDGSIINGSSVIADNGILVGGYSIAPDYSYYPSIGENATITLTKWKSANWLPNEDGPFQVKYYKGLANADHLASNGIVHVVDDLFLNPDLMKR